MVETAIKSLLTKKHFSICDLDTVMEITQSRQNEAYKMLHALHCIDYSKMEPQLRQQIPELINEVLCNQVNVIDATDVALKGVAI